MKPYKCKEFNKYGIVRLPSKWRKKFDFIPGKLVDLVHKRDSIVVQRHRNNTTDNVRIISVEGTISIPAELKRLLSLTPDDEICIYIDKENECFIIKPL